MRRLLVLAAGVVLSGIVGCEQSITGPRPLQITLTASASSATVGDSVTFTAAAQGGYITELDADYGDGTTETHQIAGAQTATARFKHAYTASGRYTIIVTVTDGVAGTKTATIADFPVS